MIDIWHINNRNKNNTDIPEKENFVVLDGVMGVSCLWYGGEEPELIFWENVKRWCYLDELIKDQETTRKALDVVVDALKEIKDGKIPVSLGICMDINDALEQIESITKKGG